MFRSSKKKKILEAPCKKKKRETSELSENKIYTKFAFSSDSRPVPSPSCGVGGNACICVVKIPLELKRGDERCHGGDPGVGGRRGRRDWRQR